MKNYRFIFALSFAFTAGFSGINPFLEAASGKKQSKECGASVGQLAGAEETGKVNEVIAKFDPTAQQQVAVDRLLAFLNGVGLSHIGSYFWGHGHSIVVRGSPEQVDALSKLLVPRLARKFLKFKPVMSSPKVKWLAMPYSDEIARVKIVFKTHPDPEFYLNILKAYGVKFLRAPTPIDSEQRVAIVEAPASVLLNATRNEFVLEIRKTTSKNTRAVEITPPPLSALNTGPGEFYWNGTDNYRLVIESSGQGRRISILVKKGGRIAETISDYISNEEFGHFIVEGNGVKVPVSVSDGKGVLSFETDPEAGHIASYRYDFDDPKRPSIVSTSVRKRTP